MVYLFLILLNFFTINLASADTSFAEIYLNKLKNKTEEKELTIESSTPSATTASPAPIPNQEIKQIQIFLPQKEGPKNEKNDSPNFKIELSPSFEFFSIKSTDNSTHSIANLNSELCSKYNASISLLNGDSEYSFSYLINNIHIENLPTSSTKKLNDRKQISHSFSSSAKFQFTNNELKISAGIVDNIFVRSTNASNFTIDKIDSPFVELGYKYNFHTSEKFSISPYVNLANNFQAKNNLYSIKNSQNADAGIEFSLKIKKLKLGIDSNYFYKKQRSDYSNDVIKGISSGINLAFEF